MSSNQRSVSSTDESVATSGSLVSSKSTFYDLLASKLWQSEHDAHNSAVNKRVTKYAIISALTALGAGLGSGALGKLFSGLNIFKTAKNTQADNDSQAIDYLNSLGANITGDGQSAQTNNSSSFMSALNNLFNGKTSGSNGVGGLLSGLLGVGSDYASSVLNFQNMEKLIDKQNAYNTPSAQMQRFEDAGLNPNLVYGLGNNGNQPASGSIAPVDFATAQRENRLAKMQIMTQTKLAQADIAQKMSQANLADQQAENVQVQKAYQQLVNNNYLTELQVRLDQMNADKDRLVEEKRRISAIAEQEEAYAKYAPDIARLDKEIKEKEKEIADTRANYAEAQEVTGAIGNILGINLGAGYHYSRSNTTSRRY